MRKRLTVAAFARLCRASEFALVMQRTLLLFSPMLVLGVVLCARLAAGVTTVNDGTAPSRTQDEFTGECGVSAAVVNGIPQPNIQAMPAPNYLSFTPPVKVGSYNDPNFGCQITRLSDILTVPNQWCGAGVKTLHHNYVPNVVNQNDDRILVLSGNGSYFVIDTAGHQIVTCNPGAWHGTSQGGVYWGRAPGEAYTLYYKNAGNERLTKVDLSKCTAASPCSDLTRPTSFAASFTCARGWAQNNEDDMRYNAASGKEYVGWDCANTINPNAQTDFSLLDVTDGTMSPSVTLPISETGTSGNGSWDNYKIVRGVGSAFYMCINIGTPPSGPRGASYGSAKTGVWCYDQNMTNPVEVSDVDQHGNTVWDPVNSKSYWVMEQSGNDLARNPCTARSNGYVPTGLEKIDVMTGNHTCVLEMPPGCDGASWSTGGHVSGSDYGVISYDPTDGDISCGGTDVANPSLPTNWQSMWRVFFNELLVVDIPDATVYRVANFRSRTNGPDACSSYWATPRASLSIDAKRLIFDSNMTHIGVPLPPCISNYTDVYMVTLPQGSRQ